MNINVCSRPTESPSLSQLIISDVQQQLFQLTGSLFSVSCSAELWLLTSGSWAPWGTALLDVTCSAPSTGSSCRWSTRQPCRKTWRRLQIAGASISSRTSLWRAVISSGRASQAPRCHCSTDPVCLVWDRQMVRGQQRQQVHPREEGWSCHGMTRRTSPVRQIDVPSTQRTWRRRRSDERVEGWRGNRQTSQVQI